MSASAGCALVSPIGGSVIRKVPGCTKKTSTANGPRKYRFKKMDMKPERPCRRRCRGCRPGTAAAWPSRLSTNGHGSSSDDGLGVWRLRRFASEGGRGGASRQSGRSRPPCDRRSRYDVASRWPRSRRSGAAMACSKAAAVNAATSRPGSVRANRSRSWRRCRARRRPWSPRAGRPAARQSRLIGSPSLSDERQKTSSSPRNPEGSGREAGTRHRWRHRDRSRAGAALFRANLHAQETQQIWGCFGSAAAKA